MHLLIVLIVILLVISALARSPSLKGSLGEFMVNIGTRLFLDKHLLFLQAVQRAVREHDIAGKLAPGAVLAKKIDEYHYVRIVKGMAPP